MMNHLTIGINKKNNPRRKTRTIIDGGCMTTCKNTSISRNQDSPVYRKLLKCCPSHFHTDQKFMQSLLTNPTNYSSQNLGTMSEVIL